MRFDIQNELMSSQAVTGAATVSTNAYQKQSAAQDISIGRRMALLFYFHATGGSTTHTLQAIQADDAALSTNKAVVATTTVTSAQLAAAPEPFVELPIPAGSLSQLFIGAQVSESGGTTTATISCWLMPLDEIEHFKSFPKVVDALT